MRQRGLAFRGIVRPSSASDRSIGMRRSLRVEANDPGRVNVPGRIRRIPQAGAGWMRQRANANSIAAPLHMKGESLAFHQKPGIRRGAGRGLRRAGGLPLARATTLAVLHAPSGRGDLAPAAGRHRPKRPRQGRTTVREILAALSCLVAARPSAQSSPAPTSSPDPVQTSVLRRSKHLLT